MFAYHRGDEPHDGRRGGELELARGEQYRRTARRLTLVLFLAQSLASAGFIAAATVGSIVGADLSGEPAWAGVPSGVYLLSGAVAALGWGFAMDRIGRRGGLSLGLAMGVVGAAIAAGAIVAESFPLFLGGLTLMGSANAAVQLGRFAAAEVHLPDERGRAISNVVVGGTVGAVVGPLLVGPTGQWMSDAGFNELAGPYAVGSFLFAVGLVLVYARLRPDPRDLGREVARLHAESGTEAQAVPRDLSEILRDPTVRVAMVAMVFAQVVMVMLMVITSLHMKVHHHSLAGISVVVSSHTLGMYAFSVLSGRLTDRWGRGQVIIAGSFVLLLSCLMAPVSTDLVPLSVALFLLGLGWNFCYVGGSSLLSDQLSPEERARTQGLNDLFIGVAAAAGSLSSGAIFATVGYGAMGVIGAAASIVPLAFTARWLIRPPSPVARSSTWM